MLQVSESHLHLSMRVLFLKGLYINLTRNSKYESRAQKIDLFFIMNIDIKLDVVNVILMNYTIQVLSLHVACDNTVLSKFCYKIIML